MNPAGQPNSPEKRTPPLQAILVAALWTSLINIFSLGLYLTSLDSPFPLSFGEAVLQSFRDWLPWMLVSPLILWLAARFRLERQTWRSSLALHLAACVFLTLAYQLLLDHTRIASPTMVIRTASGGEAAGPIGQHLVGKRLARVKSFEEPVPDQLFLGPPPFEPSHEGGFTLAFKEPLQENRWSRFFHMALIRGQFTLPLYWAMVVACWAASYYQESRERERRALELEASLSRANLQALKMQLQPHFLFNTLNAISALVHENPDAADEMLGSLSDLLRMSLEFSDQQEVSLRQELEFLECYLSIQQTRFGSRLHVHKDIDPAALGARVPTFLLQPFVENAVQHGIEPRKAGGTISLRAWTGRDRLYLEISDDGQGLSATPATPFKEGIGLSNSKARLRELYGSDHHFSLKRGISGGVCVALEIPLKFQDENAFPISSSPVPA